jgi:O-antigen/teichoic acid export membrane protein
MANRFRTWDWKLFKGSAMLSFGMAAAGAFGFAFSAVVARGFSPSDYGSIQYAISIASVVSISTQPFGQHLIARFVGKYRENEEGLRQIMSNILLILVVLTGVTLLVAAPALRILGSPNIMGTLIVFLGITVFYIYWGLARGFLMPGMLTIAYLGGNFLQLLMAYFVIHILAIHSPLLVLAIYGICFFLPPLLLQIYKPFPFQLDLRQINGTRLREVLGFAGPIWISHGSYMLYTTLDVILLARYWGTAAVGVYGIAKTLASVALYLPTGISTFLMPKIAGSPVDTHSRLLTRSLAITLASCVAALGFYILLGRWIVLLVFGERYVYQPGVAIVLSLGMVMQATHSVVTSALVGAGRPGWESVSRIAAVCCGFAAGLLFVPVHGALGAATVILSGSIAALLTYGILVVLKKRFGWAKTDDDSL